MRRDPDPWSVSNRSTPGSSLATARALDVSQVAASVTSTTRSPFMPALRMNFASPLRTVAPSELHPDGRPTTQGSVVAPGTAWDISTVVDAGLQEGGSGRRRHGTG